MRIFVAGASGAIGMQLLPLLVEADHQVAGMTRSPHKVPEVEALGAEAVLCDAYDADALRSAVVAFSPDLVMHQLTDLPDDPSEIEEYLGRNDRARSEGTRNLIAAAEAAGAARFLAQSIAWKLPDGRGATIQAHERAVLDAGGVVVRYGMFYGPGTYHPHDRPPTPRIHVHEAARQTVELLDAPSDTYEIVEAADDHTTP
jgi:nucleoside-diphosphate-sugar epimerase